jgi:lysozyme family protein
MNFDTAFTKLMIHEGGTVDNPRDPGGLTRFGISKRSYPHLAIDTLTEWDAKQIYSRDFWGMVQAEALPDAVRFSVFDGAVNSGPAQSIKWLQRAVGVTADGVIGPVTKAAFETLNGDSINARYNGYRLEFMAGLPNWENASKGWARRIATNLKES